MHWKPVGKGLLTYVPGLLPLVYGARGTGGSVSARYCYSVWLRHLVWAHQNGLSIPPKTVAELGPGDSLGIGIAALLCGADRYYAFDIVHFAESRRNLDLLCQILELFENRVPIPDQLEIPTLHPTLPDYRFPSGILDDERLSRTLAPARVDAVRSALMGDGNSQGIIIEYVVPWDRAVREDRVDFVFSQACLEHIDDLVGAYDAMLAWLQPDGFISHQIDFGSHGITPEWDGHRQYPERIWKLVRGRRPFMINRQPLSAHMELIEQRFTLCCCNVIEETPATPIQRLAPAFRDLAERDRSARGAFIQAIRQDRHRPMHR
jgi:hypothetical protein